MDVRLPNGPPQPGLHLVGRADLAQRVVRADKHVEEPVPAESPTADSAESGPTQLELQPLASQLPVAADPADRPSIRVVGGTAARSDRYYRAAPRAQPGPAPVSASDLSVLRAVQGHGRSGPTGAHVRSARGRDPWPGRPQRRRVPARVGQNGAAADVRAAAARLIAAVPPDPPAHRRPGVPKARHRGWSAVTTAESASLPAVSRIAAPASAPKSPFGFALDRNPDGARIDRSGRGRQRSVGDATSLGTRWRQERLVDRIACAQPYRMAHLCALEESGLGIGVVVLPPLAAWGRLRDMELVLAREPAVAQAVRCLTLSDQLDLTLELLRQPDWPEFEEHVDLPPNVVRFRPLSLHPVSGALFDALVVAGGGC